ncbi:cytochrome c [Paraburkholderia madseniana]|uniref:Cytochrome c n=1 Tax=Paraburkholderia madseniana TaxID=2599607 RepID=A0A6N6WGI1_9BURK|nr:cytochrome c [Paraburkholderia madseniana]KAE8758520.1 cytochrome c [Paraburkholderia madseniana]
MNLKLLRIAAVWAAPVAVGAIAALTGSHYLPESIAGQAQRQAALVPPVHFAPLDVSLPAGNTLFPPGEGAEIANANCVMCHSTGMVLRQPPLTTPEWKTEIMKMRNGFGAPIPLDQVDQLAHYLGVINGKKNEAGPSGVDNQAS